MEPTPPHTGTRQPRGPRKRNRPALSCGHCRFRKLKCNRALPCEACLKSGDRETCSYGSRERRVEDQPSTQLAEKDALTSRIDRLEALLMSAVSNTTPQFPHVSSDGGLQFSTASDGNTIEPGNGREIINMEQLGKEFGVMKVNPTQTVYHGGHHWVSTMFQIQEFRDYLEANSDDLGRAAIENKKIYGEDENVVSLLRGTNDLLTEEELLSYIPSRAVTDMLVDQFFNHVGHMMPVLHEPTFRQEYIEHWENPNETEVSWLGLLFSILHQAALSFDREEDKPSPSRTSEYRQRTVQCLLAANYTDPQLYTIETLILHIYAEWMSSQDSSTEVSLLLAIVIRLAMRMGMHRDSRAYESVKPFRGEMRRRVWAIIRTMDIICSFQLSLPATIHPSGSRCALPRNIFNDEFYRDVKELPPPRPLSEVTEISCTIIKTRLTLELGKILAFAEFENDPSSEDISKYEQSLDEVKRMIPETLNVSFTREPTEVPASLYRQRIDLDRLYQASRCVLHRKSLSQARHDPSKLQHRGNCVDAAMALLAHQATLHLDLDTSYPQNIRNRHIYTLTTYDFFTAAMAVALDLHYGFETEPFTPSPSDASLWGYDRRNEMITALETSSEFCRISKDESVEAAHAYGILSVIVAKARKAQWIIEEQQVRGRSQISDSDMDILMPEFGTDFQRSGPRFRLEPLGSTQQQL